MARQTPSRRVQGDTWLEDAAIKKALNHLTGAREQIDRIVAETKLSAVVIKADEARGSISGTRALLRELRAALRKQGKERG